MNNIPKNYLVRLIIENADDLNIRKHFSIKEETNLFSRLNSYSIAKLDEFIYKQDSRFAKIFENYSEEFPLRSAPTLYILNKSKLIAPKALEEKSAFLASRGRGEALVFPDTRAIRAIYTRQPIHYLKKQNVYELVLGYEKRIELVECDPESQNYSETRVEYSLENALVWYPKSNSSYAVITCCDFSAVSSMITYLNQKYGIDASLPDLTETMLNNLATGSKVRNATFTLELPEENESDIDVNSITIYDKKLSESKIYSQMKEQKGRIQRSGFFVDHPYLLRAGLGISCKYERIWTPAHLDRNELISIAVGSINKLDAQLKNAAENDLADYFIYYSNKEVQIDSIKITGSARKLFDRLIYYLALSQKNNNIEHEKCNINDYHPKADDCRECAKRQISKIDFESNTICLLRTFGIPISFVFDGIHHGHEFADIVYTDEFDDKQHKIAIHVKKHAKHTPAKGLGRSNDKIKGLYAQVFYTLFELEKKKKSVDTIGIAIPNRVSTDVLNSMQTIVLRMGYSFIALQKDDWEKITQAAIDAVQF